MSDEKITETEAPKTCSMCRFAAPANPDSPGNLYCSVDKAVVSVNPTNSCEKYKEPDHA